MSNHTPHTTISVITYARLTLNYTNHHQSHANGCLNVVYLGYNIFSGTQKIANNGRRRWCVSWTDTWFLRHLPCWMKRHIVVLTTILRNRKQQGLSTFSAFIDFSKAFDSVSHTALWHKLLAYGIHGNMLNTIKCLYSNLQSCVRVNGRLTFTDWFSQSAGVRQGENLAPTLFALFINDLAAEINNLGRGVDIDNRCVSIILYVDDIVFIAETEEHLPQMLDTLHGWTRDWMLSVNLEKTKNIHFRKSSTAHTEFLFTLGTHPVDLETQYRYLGLDLSETLDFTHGVSLSTKSASRALGKVTSKYFSINGLSPTVYKRMYDSLVVPVMDYAAVVWGTKRYDACVVVQNRAMRTFLCVGRCSPLPGICGTSDGPQHSPGSRQQPYRLLHATHAYATIKTDPSNIWMGQLLFTTHTLWKQELF